MSAILELTISPMDKGGSLTPYVSRAVGIIKSCGLPYIFGPMGTCIEGEYDAVMGVARQCFEALKTDCDRISITMRVDYRKQGENRLAGKVQSVEAELAELQGRA
ncbi:MAG: MTH1187 family thiamine-binding protein [Desulfovibrio sp.]|uniref:MTH1187 family thiamine-binding protein n=1 Tax=Desulfovibrio sp. 7SRBS1 TaxID=3378064 RepID=UPI003B3CCC99